MSVMRHDSSANTARQANAAPLVVARGLCKHYDGRRVLAHVDLDVRHDETVAILGANGAGKSTLLRLLAAVVRPDEGTLHLGNSDAIQAPEQAREHTALLLQDPPLYDELTADEHVAWWQQLTGRAPGLGATVTNAGLALRATESAARLSRGQRQRLALALAFAGPPALLLLDEPFTALDANGTVWLEALLAQRRGRQATVLALHSEAQATRLADRVLRLQGGRLVAP